MLLTTCVERMVAPPYGLQGGAPGETFHITLERNGVLSDLPGKANLFLQEGDLVTISTCGGGGYGPPSFLPSREVPGVGRDGTGP